MLTGDIPPNQNNLQLRNLNEKVKKEELNEVTLLFVLFNNGRILDTGRGFVMASMGTDSIRKKQSLIALQKQKESMIQMQRRRRSKKKKLRERNVLKKLSNQLQLMGNLLKTSFRQGNQSAQETVPPNNILFIQNLPHETTSMMLQVLFQQYPGFREVRMIEAKPGIAFVEFEDDVQSSMAMQALQGFKITPQNPMAITYAKK
ncbi:hypothetical protein NC651_040532 [Populus alba x Populus x berolinensis]|nr:hypothetical protein NC651_040532 [Populus alba x Populus x berolinensis]